MKRVLIIGAIGVAVLGGAIGAVFAANPITVKITIPAAAMKPRVLAFRDRFQEDYLDSGTALPVYTLIYRAAANPNDIATQKMIAMKADGSPRLVTFSADKRTLVSDGNAAPSAAFAVFANGKASNVTLDIPAHIQSSVELKRDSAGRPKSLRFQLANPLAVHPRGLNTTPKLPDTVYLRAVTLDDASFNYEFGDRESSPNVIYSLNLDLNAKGPSK